MCICLSVPHYCMNPYVTWGNGRGCLLVAQYWVDLQLVHRFRCYDNIQVCKLIALYGANVYSAEHKMSASACTRSMASCCWRMHLRAVCLQPFGSNVISWVQSLQPPSSLDCGQLLTICDIVYHLPQGHVGCCKAHFFRQDAQCPWLVQKRFRSAQQHLGRSNPGCRIVGSSTRTELTITAIHLATYFLVNPSQLVAVLIFFLHLFQAYVSSHNRPKLVTSSSIPPRPGKMPGF